MKHTSINIFVCVLCSAVNSPKNASGMTATGVIYMWYNYMAIAFVKSEFSFYTQMKLSDIFSTPSNWSPQHDEVTEVQLSSCDSEYFSVKCKLTGTPLQNLKKITRIQNPYLYYRYMMRKQEYEAKGKYVDEKLLFHATGVSKLPLIITNNLDWRLANRVKFGKGVSFSPCSTYANKECSRYNGCDRVAILCKVLVGQKSRGSYSTTLPPNGYDSTYGNGDNVIVKYYDDEFYPTYAAYYRL